MAHGHHSSTQNLLFVIIYSFLSPFPTSDFLPFNKGNHPNAFCMYFCKMCIVLCVLIFYLKKVVVLNSHSVTCFFVSSTLCFKGPSCYCVYTYYASFSFFLILQVVRSQHFSCRLAGRHKVCRSLSSC